MEKVNITSSSADYNSILLFLQQPDTTPQISLNELLNKTPSF
jgi:hypothetical protein